MVNKVTENKKPCLWMEAGVIDFKICNHNFDCATCEFDQAMSEAATHKLVKRQADQEPLGRKAKVVPWEEKMRQRFRGKQKCRLMLTRLCHECSFDELLEEQFDFFLAPVRPKVQDIFGIGVPTSSFLHRGHTWVALENAGRVRIGLDDFSQKLLGPADNLRLPDIGEEIHSDEVVLALSRGGKKAAVLAPVNGIIEAVNPKVRQKPSLAHEDPYGEGWLFVVTPSNLKPDLEKMLFGQCNVSWIENESNRLLGMLESAAGVTLPSGGTIIDDVYGHYPQLGWERLVQEFLQTA
jgi:glycine cleavage system H lipoate-binding protein